MAWDSDINATDWQPGDTLPTHASGCMVRGSRSTWSPRIDAWRVLDDSRVGARVVFDHRIDYRRPVLLGRTYDVAACCSQLDGRKVHLAAELLDDGMPVAEASGLFIVVDIEHFRP